MLSSPLGWGPSSQHSSGPTRARGEADLKHTCDCPRCMVHYKTCIHSLLARLRDLKSRNQDLQLFDQERSPAVAAVTGISQSYGDPMTQILSTVAEQDEVVQGYQRELRVVAASVADVLKLSNNNTLKFLARWKCLLNIMPPLHLGSMLGTDGTPPLRNPFRLSRPRNGRPHLFLNLGRRHLRHP